MADTAEPIHQHHGDYGYDGSFHTVSARGQVAIAGAGCAALAAWAGVSLARGKPLVAAAVGALAAAIVGQAALYIRTTRKGKFEVWARILDDLRLRGDETLLELGCGRGAVLLAAAKRLPQGHVVGVDVWQADQTDNSSQATLANAALEGVADRVEVHTADMTELPLEDNSVDVVVSNLAIHNIATRQGRQQAISEAARVLRPGGRLAIADLKETRRHVDQLAELGWAPVRHRNLGWRMWWGGPWFSTYLVTATKPV